MSNLTEFRPISIGSMSFFTKKSFPGGWEIFQNIEFENEVCHDDFRNTKCCHSGQTNEWICHSGAADVGAAILYLCVYVCVCVPHVLIFDMASLLYP